jgi:uncharacterized repeat protein (TIGR02543 family)
MRYANHHSSLSALPGVRSLRPLLLALLALIGPAAFAVPLNTAGVPVSSQELQIASFMASSSGQHRPFLKLDPTLCAVAEARAKDMAARHYFGHVNPDGHGPNYLVRAAGYPLPDWWGTDPQANYIESIAAGYSNPSDTWNAWMNSTPHRTHLLAEDSFYADQTSVGVGYYHDSSSDYHDYWVVISAPPRPAAPLTIKAPSNNARVTAADVVATGTASTDSSAATVEYAIENSNGVGTYQTASGVTSWQASIKNLNPGDNTLHVRSRDSSGTLVAEATRRIHYAVLRGLNVELAGQGSVTNGFAGLTKREVGNSYTIKATAQRGYRFAGWTGSLTSTSNKISFKMADGYSLTANFVPNPFSAVTNTYQGLINTSIGAGMVKIVSTGSGKFFGKLILDGAAQSFTGKFALDGTAQVTVPTSDGGTLTFNLQLDLTGGSNQITGSVTDGTDTAALSLDGKAYDAKNNPATEAGRYTMVLPADKNSNAPAGNGFAVVKISKSGLALITGKLADGTSFVTSSFLNADGHLTVYVPLYKKSGYLAGDLVFSAQSGSDFSGILTWAGPAFSASLNVIGSAYVNDGALTFSGAASVTLQGGDLSNSVDATVQISGNTITADAPNTAQLQLKVNATSGVITGKFIDPTTSEVHHLAGVIFEKQNAAAGSFENGGTFSLTAAP